MNQFQSVAMKEGHSKWNEAISRSTELYHRSNDIRSEFARDYTRILHCLAYRRLKHKTQVFFNTHNDHICTRMEHVAHVESVSYTVANALGLNCELTRAIAMGHDLGHAPFGHSGEKIIGAIKSRYLPQQAFWHEKNGLRMVDSIELLQSPDRKNMNMNLTYAVRDGIISHCGEVNDAVLYPRNEAVDLTTIAQPGKMQPYTWEGCVVKIADKIAYLGRDIEDALQLKIITIQDMKDLGHLAFKYKHTSLNTFVIMHDFITDIVENSTLDRGICLSEGRAELMNEVKNFNYRKIYSSERLEYFVQYSKLVLESIFDALLELYLGEGTLEHLYSSCNKGECLYKGFFDYIIKYCEEDYIGEIVPESIRDNRLSRSCTYDNQKIYRRLETRELYIQAILDYIAGMTDGYAIQCFNELIAF